MKISKQYNLIISCLIAILSLGISMDGYAQCGTEAITVSPWCENTFGKWQFTSPTPNAQYNWYNYAAGPYIYDANGFISQNNGVPISAVDTTTGNTFYSTFRITSPLTSVEYTYQKSVKYKNINPFPAVTPALTNNAAGSTFSMDFTTNITNARGVRIDSVSVPVQLTGAPGTQYKIQVNFGTLGGPGSAIYTFTSLSAKSLGGNNYLVKIPVNYTVTTSGAQTMFVNTNPTGGTGIAVNGLLYSPSHAPAFSATGNPISIAAGSGDAGPSGGFSQIYDLSYSIVCLPLASGPSTKTTVGCCVIPANYNLFAVNPDKNSIVNAGAVNVNFVAGGSAANYFGWYLNGSLVTGAVGLKNYSSNLVGNWEVREVVNSADINNPSCVARASTTIYDKKIIITNTSAPSHTPLCIGDTWSFTGSGTSALTWSSGKPVLSKTSGTTTTYTATTVGSDAITLSGKVVSGDLVTKGNFTGATDVDFGHTGGYSTPAGITGADGNFSIVSTAPNQSDWNANGTKPLTQGNPGEFLLVNGTGNATSKPVIWAQNLNVQAQQYTFSFDLTSVTYMVSDNADGSNFGGTATAPWRDVVLEVFINGVSQGTVSTDFAANGGINAVGKWKTHQFIWNSPSAGVAAVEIRQTTPSNQLRGYDYGLDNISFGGLVTQTDTYNIGPVTDCSTLTATASACVNDTYSNLTATLTGGLVFQYWELASNPGVSVGTTNPLQVSTITSASYNAVATLAVGNLLDNGNFESGALTGFVSGGQYYTNSTSLGAGGDDVFDVSTDSKNGNGAWLTLPPPPGSTGTRIFAADAKTPNKKVIAWEFTATAGTQYLFSGWGSNNHVDFTNSNAATANPANLGIVVVPGNASSAPAYPGGGNVLLTSLNFPRNNDWQKLTATWTPATSGTYTLYVINLNPVNGGGSNDFVLDDFILASNTGITKKANAVTPVCNPCLSGIPTVATKTFCANVGTVKLTPAATDPASVEFDWYNTAGPTGGTKIGTSVGSATTTLDLTGIVADGSGNKTVWYQKSAKGSGIVFKKSEACGVFTGNNRTGGPDQNYQTRFSATKPITISQVGLTVYSEVYNPGDNLSGTVTFTVVGSRINNGFAVADPTISYGTLTATYSKAYVGATSTGAQTEYADIIATGNVSVPAGVFFIYPTTVNKTGNGNFSLQRGSDCTQPNTVDDFDGTTVSRTGMSQNGSNNQTGNNNSAGYVYNVKFALPAYVCPRVPVVLTPSCPCNKPTSVTVNGGTTPITKCVGDAAFTVSGAYVNSGNPIANTSMAYVWYKQGTTPGAYTNLPAPTPVTSTASQTVTARNFTAPVVADAGTWILRVEDGNTGNSSCYTENSVVLNVNPKPTVTGATTVCVGSSITLTGSATAHGTTPWVSGTPANATVSNTGVVTGVAAGTSVITYMNTNGCTQTHTVTVNALPTVTGATTVCVGSSITLTGSATAHATTPWVSGTPANATVSNAGVVTGVAAGTSVITYMNTNGCTVTHTVTVYPRPTVTGATTVCIGSSITLTGSATAHGTTPWVSGTPANATVSNTGVVTGVAAGTSVITYMNTNGCTQTHTVTVNALPTITGATTVCVGSSITLTGSATAHGTTPWVSGTPANATVSNAGVVTGVAAGTSVITYMNTNGCTVTHTVTVNPRPTVTGATTVCIGSSITLTGSATAHGTTPWVSGTPANATVSNAGVVTGVAAGTSVITYMNTNGCTQTHTVTVNALPTVTGATTVCVGSSITLTGSATAHATTPWVSGTPANATVSNAGVVAGVAAGTSVITYMNTNGCTTTHTVTVYPVPTITGGLTICVNATTQLTGSGTPATSGAWVSASTGVATVSNTGLVTGVAGGTSLITYTNNGGCQATATITVSATAPAGVTLTAAPGVAICEGTSVTFTAAPTNEGTPTYVWTSSVQGNLPSTTATYTNTVDLVDGEVITVRMTSSLSCANPTFDTDALTMDVTTKVTPTITIQASKTTICPDESVTFSILTETNGGTAPAKKYQWRKGGVDIASATNATYTAPANSITNGNVFDVVMTTGLSCVSSATATAPGITITVTPVPVINVSITPTTGAICSGQPFVFNATVTGSGSTPAPTYEWFITSNTGTTPPGTSQGAPSTTATSLSTSALTATNNKVYVQVVSNATCAATTAVASNVAVIAVTTGVDPGSIQSDQEICNGSTPAPLTELTPAVGITATAVYTWEESLNGSSGWGVVPGSGTGYTFPGALTQDVYVRRVVTDAGLPGLCNTATTDAVYIKVSAVVAAGTIDGTESICKDAVTTTMGSLTLPTGGQGTFTYVWQSAPDVAGAAGTFTDITTAGATGATYNAGPLSATTYFRRKEVNTCGTVFSNVIVKTVTLPETVTAVIDNVQSQTCASASSIVFTANGSSSSIGTGPGTGTLHYAWTLNNIPVGTDNATYTYSPVLASDNGKVVQVVVSTSNGCNNGTSSDTYTLDIVSSITPAIVITGPADACAGVPVTYTAVSTNGGSGASYQWYRIPAGGSAPGIPVGTNATTYRTANLANGDKVYAELTSTSGCLSASNPFTSNVLPIHIEPIPTPTITEGDQTICSPNSFTFHGVITAGNTAKWVSIPSNTVVGTGVDFPVSQSGTYALNEDNGICNTNSSPVVLTVIPTPVANAGTDIYIKEGDNGNLSGSGGAIYSWTPSTYLDNASVSNPNFVATQTITYVLTVSDATNTCHDEDDVTVVVVSPVKVPNVITVNGDGNNDDWEIENIEGYPNVIIEIYNRWGNLVWKTEGYPKNWDGTNFRNGQVLPDGTYFYIINLQSQIYDEPLTGWVQIVK